MEDYGQKTSWLTWLLGGLTLVLLAGGIYYYNQNQDLTQQTDLAGQRADSLLSVKLQLEGDVRQLTDQLTSAKSTNTELAQQREEINRRLAAANTSLRDVQRKANGRVQTIGELNRTIGDLNGQRDSLNNQMNAMQGKIGWLTDSNTVLSGRTEQLGQEVTRLNTTLLTMVPRYLLRGDGFRVEAVKANQKETAKAKKVNTLSISFNVPAELDLTGSHEVFLSLTDEQRNPMMTTLRTITVNTPTANEVVPVQAVQAVEFVPGQQRISFQIKPDAALKPGLYRAAIYTKDRYLGAVEFRFRDSFWFF